MEESLISGVHIDHMTINAATAGDINYANDWKLDKVVVTAKDGTTVKVDHSTNVTFN